MVALCEEARCEDPVRLLAVVCEGLQLLIRECRDCGPIVYINTMVLHALGILLWRVSEVEGNRHGALVDLVVGVLDDLQLSLDDINCSTAP